MSRSDRSEQSAARLIGTILVAVLGIGAYWAMFYSAGFGSGYNEREAQIEAQHYATETANQIERECSAKAGEAARECIADIVKAERESQRNESDLAAQWKAADWVMWASIIAGAQLIATVIGLYYIKGTLDETRKAVEDTSEATEAMREANKIARETSKRQMRAYVGVEDHEVINFGIGLTTGHQCKVWNRGQTPAYDVRIWSYPTCVISAETEPHDAKIKPPKLIVQSSAILGPGQWVGHTNPNTKPMIEASYLGLCAGGLTIVWGGVVSYRDAFGKRRRTTFKYFATGTGEHLKANFDMCACASGNSAS